MRNILLFLLFSASLLGIETLNEDLQRHISVHSSGENKVGKISIDDKSNGISQATWIYVKNALDHYKKEKPDFIILELNTPGGEVFSAQKISDALKQIDIQDGIPVVAYINNWAISAGAMLAYSCRYIAIVKDASMGAAEPVLQDTTTNTLKEASEKVNSAFRTDFANRAAFFDRNPLIAEAMVDKDVILVLRHGKIMKLDAESQIITSGQDPDIVISPKGKLLTLDAKHLMEYGVANILLEPVKLEPITETELEKGSYPAIKELLFTYPFFHSIPNAVVDLYQMDWKTRLFVLLAHPMVSSALVLAMMLGFYIEINTPGFGLPGTIALAALGLLILSSFSQEAADYLELILLLSGLLIIVVDLFLLPTFGILGFIGVLLFGAGLAGILLPGIGSIQFEFDTQTFNAAGELFFKRLAMLLVTFAVGVLLIAIIARYLQPNILYLKRLVLTGHEQNGYRSGIDQELMPKVGSKGTAYTPMHPAGKIIVEGSFIDAVSTGRYIEKGTAVRVVRIEGSTAVVEAM